LSAVSQLWSTGYGQAILVKTGLFAVLLGLGSLSRSRVLAGVERVRNVVLAELVLVLGVVAAVAVLTSLRPGRR
jgi:putative copper export protein